MGENARIAVKIAQIASRQHGNITRQQLLALGVSNTAIGRHLRMGRLYRLFPGVYAVGHPPTMPIERASAAILACGPRAVLSHGSAMTLHGFWRRWDEPFDVTLAADRRPTGIRIHRCRTLLRRDVAIVQNIPVTSVARTALDIAPRLRRRSLTRLINDARRAPARLDLADLADVADRNPSHPGAPLVRWHTEHPGNPTRSGGEDDFPVFCQRHGLPTPLINTTVHGFEVDAYFPQERLIVELDGWPFHRDRSSFESDRDRDATMLAYEIPTLRITYGRLEDDEDREAARLNTILRQRRRAA